MTRPTAVFLVALLACGCTARDPVGLTSGAPQGPEHPPAAQGALAESAGRPDRLCGNPGDPTGAAIPDRRFEPRVEDYSQPHPRRRGRLLSFNTLQLIFTPGTTVGEANALLDQIDARVIAGIPGTAELPGLLFLRVPTTSHREMLDLLALLWQDPRVQHVVQDAWFEGSRPPP